MSDCTDTVACWALLSVFNFDRLWWSPGGPIRVTWVCSVLKHLIALNVSTTRNQPHPNRPWKRDIMLCAPEKRQGYKHCATRPSDGPLTCTVEPKWKTLHNEDIPSPLPETPPCPFSFHLSEMLSRLCSCQHLSTANKDKGKSSSARESERAISLPWGPSSLWLSLSCTAWDRALTPLSPIVTLYPPASLVAQQLVWVQKKAWLNLAGEMGKSFDSTQ